MITQHTDKVSGVDDGGGVGGVSGSGGRLPLLVVLMPMFMMRRAPLLFLSSRLCGDKEEDRRLMIF